jgi:hypothetical protein
MQTEFMSLRVELNMASHEQGNELSVPWTKESFLTTSAMFSNL